MAVIHVLKSRSSWGTQCVALVHITSMKPLPLCLQRAVFMQESRENISKFSIHGPFFDEVLKTHIFTLTTMDFPYSFQCLQTQKRVHATALNFVAIFTFLFVWKLTHYILAHSPGVEQTLILSIWNLMPESKNRVKNAHEVFLLDLSTQETLGRITSKFLPSPDFAYQCSDTDISFYLLGGSSLSVCFLLRTIS